MHSQWYLKKNSGLTTFKLSGFFFVKPFFNMGKKLYFRPDI